MEAENLYEQEQHLLEDRDPTAPLLPLVPHPRKSIMVFLAVLSVFALSIISTAAAEVDITFLLICFNNGTDADQCFQSPEVSRIASSLTLYSNIILSLGGIFVVPILSAKSDLFGRKKILLWVIFCMGTGQLVKWYLVFGADTPPHYYWMLLPVIIATVGGATSCFGPMAISYISDQIHDPAERAKYISFVEASIFIAIAMGPTIGSQLIYWLNTEKLYFISIGGCTVAFILAALVVQESLSGTMKEVNADKRQRYFENIRLLSYNHIENPSRRRAARLFTICSVLGTEFMLAVLNVMFLYVKRQFGWTAVQTGYYVTTTSTHRLIAYVAGFPFLYKTFSSWWTVHPKDIDRIDLTMLRLALVLCATGFLMMGIADTQTKFVVAALVESTASYANPIYKSALMKYAPPGQFGAFIGSIALVTSLAGLIFPTMLLKLYGAYADKLPGLPFLVVSVAFAGLLGWSFLVKPKI